jgi:PucR family transcriptional regulator, purine catabolism regulatory protein
MLLDSLPDACPVGLSAEVSAPDRVSAGAREARWALHSCAPQRSRLVRYGTGGALPWGFALERADEIAGHVLGSLVQYDRSHQSELLPTLAALLRNDRSPTRTAAELFIRRQTLVYRVRRIEELTERSLSRTDDVVELWLAMKALEIVNGS